LSSFELDGLVRGPVIPSFCLRSCHASNLLDSKCKWVGSSTQLLKGRIHRALHMLITGSTTRDGSDCGDEFKAYLNYSKQLIGATKEGPYVSNLRNVISQPTGFSVEHRHAGLATS